MGHYYAEMNPSDEETRWKLLAKIAARDELIDRLRRKIARLELKLERAKNVR